MYKNPGEITLNRPLYSAGGNTITKFVNAIAQEKNTA
jgi:hypothetical protein